MFTKHIIECKTNIFEELENSVEFEDVNNVRKGAVLVDCKDNLVPIVRTTTVYNKPAQKFLSIHYDIIENIKTVTKCDQLKFNNALIEVYNSNYRSMGYHSDQSLDLDDNSYICLFSCYDNPSNGNDIRKLKIKEKHTKNCSEILLEQNSIVLFSLSTNGKYLHKIVLETNTSSNKWLGITFRLSKTFIQFMDEIPYFYSSNKKLLLANEDEKKEFFRNRGKENSTIAYKYPTMDYTISISDILSVLTTKKVLR